MTRLCATKRPLRLRHVVAASLVLLLCAPVLFAEERPPSTYEPAPAGEPYDYPDEFLGRIATLPVQDGGRVKPLSSWAGFTLLQINGRRSVKTPDGRRLDAVAWALDTLFFPERAQTYDVFLIEDEQLLEDMGLTVEGKKKRDRYSYEDLSPKVRVLRDKVSHVAGLIESGRMRAQDLSRLQRQQRTTLNRISLFEGVLHALDVAREPIDVSAVKDQPQWFQGRTHVSMLEAFDRYLDLHDAMVAKTKDLKKGDPVPPDVDALTKLAADIGVKLRHRSSTSAVFSVLPQTSDPEVYPRWLAPANLGLSRELHPTEWGGREDLRAEFAPIRKALSSTIQPLMHAARDRADRAAFVKHMDGFRDAVVSAAKRRGEYDRVEMEVGYYAFEPFYKALVTFVIAFVLIALSWFFSRSKWLYGAAVALTVVALLLTVGGITWRGLIRQRPPVSTLYETIPFITASCVLACLVIEWINRRRVAMVLGIALGALGLWLENRYQAIDRQDTMPTLQAVLRTNFWLSTHVTTVTIGYAAGLLAAALAHVHVLGRVFGFKRNDGEFYRELSRMIYGTLCFGLLFSVVGTILGGVWANDSWGRFWGWDPKENGALLICLWELAILHARMGGYIKSHGIAMAGVFTGPVVAFSWWGVNQLQVGLHSYGFIQGIDTALNLFYLFELAVLVAGTTWWLLRLGEAKSQT